MSINELRSTLTEASREWLTGGKLEAFVQEQIASPDEAEKAIAIAQDRFGVTLTPELVGPDAREALLRAGEKFFRREVTELERFVLLQIFDAAWKDHLLAMDHLKGGIGLRSYAEQDPRVAFKREGARLYEEMIASVRERVSDMIFKVRLTPETQMRSVYQVSNMNHAAVSAYDTVQRPQAKAAAMPDRSEPVDAQKKPQTFVKTQEKVGRNDPCPCGSGKKFKKCCGQTP